MTEQAAGTGLDHTILRKASLRIALRISAACAVLVLVLVAAAAAYLFNRAGGPAPDALEPGAIYAYLDTQDLLKAMLIAGTAGIGIAGGIGWISARSAIRPLGEALAIQRRFVQDASHELRTPLAILDARIQLAQRASDPGSEASRALEKIRSDTATLTGIVTELLEAVTGAAPTVTTHPVDVAEVAADVVNGMKQLANERGIDLHCTHTHRPHVLINEGGLRRAILALTDNALAHTPTSGRVTVTISTEGHHAIISVHDTGTGITGVDQDRIFERFVRTSTTAPHGQRGFGIGLALVSEIAFTAGGTVTVAATGPQGTDMRLKLPLAQQA